MAVGEPPRFFLRFAAQRGFRTGGHGVEPQWERQGAEDTTSCWDCGTFQAEPADDSNLFCPLLTVMGPPKAARRHEVTQRPGKEELCLEVWAA